MKRALPLVLLLLSVLACRNSRTSAYKITYEVTGSARVVSLTYNNEGGDTEQLEGRSLPWTKSFTSRQGSFLYVSAQNLRDQGDVTTKITVNGQTIKTSTSSGGYVIATASATCCAD